jgi:DNA-binding transcriptional LysR family regulator
LERNRLLLAEADSLGERARALKGGDIGLLRIGAPPQVIEALFAPFAWGGRQKKQGFVARHRSGKR